MTDSTTVEELTLEEKVGQLLHVGIGLGYLETETGWPSTEMRSIIEEIQPGAVRVYGTHQATPHYMAQYTNQLQEWAEECTDNGLPLLISCDAEYGTVDMVAHGARAYPALMGRTVTGDTDLARDVSAAIAEEMCSLGFNMNHQPVVDVNTNPDNPVIGVRSPGSDPETVSEYATAALQGIHEEDQVGVAKHFPGHGDTELDSHMVLPHVTYNRETLERIHLPPFETMIEAGVDCIMTSHIVVECLDPEQPATLSKPVLTGLLREELGYDGIIITDAMMMDAISDNYGVGEATVQAVQAGVDLVLTGYVSAADLLESRDALLKAVEGGRLSEARVDESVERVLSMKAKYDLDDRRYNDPVETMETYASEENESIAREAYDRSLTVLGNEDVFPIAEDDSILLTGIRNVQALEPHLDAAFGDVLSCSLSPSDPGALNAPKPAIDSDSLDESLATLQSVAGSVDIAVVTTYSREAFPEGQRRIVEVLAGELPVIVVSLGLPNEFEALPDDVAYIATYAQDRLGMPAPIPDTACSAIVDLLGDEPEALDSLPVQ